MRALSRRLFLASSAMFAVLAARPSLAGNASAGTDEPTGSANKMSLREALNRRKSIRLYSPEPLEDDVRTRLLWSANGVNRPEADGRTAPSWHGARDIDIYLAESDGVSRYEPALAGFTEILRDDIRKLTSPEPFVATAPTVLIYVSDQSRVVESAKTAEAGQPPEKFAADHRLAAFVDTAVIAQNVYLFCASESLGTCLVGGSDPAAISKALNLPADRMVTYVQPVGHPRS